MILAMTYELILAVHIGAFITNISLVVLADLLGLLWMLGAIRRLPKKSMIVAHYLIWLGLATSIASGAYLFWPAREYLLTVESFYVKVTLVLVLLINSFFISKHLRTALSTTFKRLSLKERGGFLLSGFVSLGAWIGVIVAATRLGL
jgi:hypothetical protein